MRKIIALAILSTIISCTTNKAPQIEALKQEIMDVESDFEVMVAKIGIQAAFVHYAAEDGVIMRNDSLIKGKADIHKYLIDANDGILLTWTPDFIDVAKSGELAYTYGKYKVLSKLDSSLLNEGVFHTVWKKQPDGNWRFVWD